MRFPLRLTLLVLTLALAGVFATAHFSLHQRLRTQQATVEALEQEVRALRQQLEAERLLAAGQLRLFRSANTEATP